MPQLGESVIEGTVGKWLKNVGDPIALYEPILEVITDKVTTEIPSPAAGTLTQILVPEGITVQAGTIIALIGDAQDLAASPTPETQSPSVNFQSPSPNPQPLTFNQPSTSADAPPVTRPPSPPIPSNGSTRTRLTPVVARMISEYNITATELASISGTGENGRVSKKDLEAFIQNRAAPSPVAVAETLPPWEQPGTGELFRPTEEVFGKSSTDAGRERSPNRSVPSTATAAVPAPTPAQPSTFNLQPSSAVADETLVPLSPMRRMIAEHMVRSKTIAPHVTTVHEADMSRVLAHFTKHRDDFDRQNVKLTYTPYFVQAVVYGLQQVPIVNAQFTEQGIAMKRDLNIGLAVAIDDGLIVPVIKNADDKSLLGLARAVNDLALRAREKKLQASEVSGGTFTLTNYGIFGSLFGTPVIAQPQSAILGIGAIQKRVIVINDAIAIRPMVYLALSFDHRLLDGAIGDTFMNHVKKFLESYPE